MIVKKKSARVGGVSCLSAKGGGGRWEAEGCNTDYMTNSVAWVLDPYLTLSSVEGTRRQQKPANDLNKW